MNFLFSFVVSVFFSPEIQVEKYSAGEPQKEIPILEGLQEGVVREFYKNGNVMQETTYVKGAKEGTWKWFGEEGSLLYQENYQQGKRQGESKVYFKSGKIWLTKNYVNGLLEGVVKEFYESGALKKETPYKQGKKVGLEIYYDGNKNVLKKTKWLGDDESVVLEDHLIDTVGYANEVEYQVVIQSIVEDSQASKVGLAVGDVITHYHHVKVKSTSQLINFVKSGKIKKDVTLKINRKGKELIFTVKPGVIGVRIVDK